MPRKAYVGDLQKAVEGVSIAGISDVQTGNDDGEFTFTCVADGQKLNISVLVPGILLRPASNFLANRTCRVIRLPIQSCLHDLWAR